MLFRTAALSAKKSKKEYRTPQKPIRTSDNSEIILKFATKEPLKHV
nr:MAG TPA: hypothetical protein [Caudoviricetes sp.]